MNSAPTPEDAAARTAGGRGGRGVARTGLKRRARLLRHALSPPQRATLLGRRPPPPPATRPVRRGQRPPKRSEQLAYGVPIAPRLVPSPVFLLAPVRSGSTLLRMLLDSHSRIRATHELHLRSIDVRLAPRFSQRAMRHLGLDEAELEHVLWDRVLSLELERSGKEVIVDKTPGNVWAWERLRHAWPDARFVILHRHPAAIVASLHDHPKNTASWEQHEGNVLKYLQPLEEARQSLPCLTVQYERLTAEPERVTRDICGHLGVAWEPGMLRYGEHDHGPFLHNLGDTGPKIKTGRIHPAEPPKGADRLSRRLRRYAARWGYD